MLTSDRLMMYYNSHSDDYPAIFEQHDNSIVMKVNEGSDAIASLEDVRAYEVYPSLLMPYVFVNSLKEDAERHHLEYDDNDPQLVLDAFINCVYLQIWRINNDTRELMDVIEGRGW